MTRVLIVDDELIVRVGIKTMIDWDKNGFEIVGDAADGEEALSKIFTLNPHIVLTDIKMPKLDGIELIKRIREKNKNIKIVVLSCYNDFDLVKQAMKMGASDYILKLSIRKEELLEVMNNLKIQIMDEFQKQNQVNTLYRRLNSNRDVIKEKIFRKIINCSYESENDVYKEAKDLNIRFAEGNYIIAVTRIAAYLNKHKVINLERELLLFSVGKMIEEILEREQIGDVVSYNNGDFIVIFTFDNSIREFKQVENELGRVLNHIHNALKTYLNIDVFSGVYDDIITEIKEIGKGYKCAVEAVEHCFYLNTASIVKYKDLHYSNLLHPYCCKSDEEEILSLFKIGEINKVKEKLNKIFDRLAEDKCIRPYEVKLICINILSSIWLFLKSFIDEEDISMPLDINVSSYEIEQTDNISALRKLFYEILDVCENFRCIRVENTYKNGIIKLKQYINENYRNNISLEQAASFLHVNKNYFCSIFKKETGETFYDYLIKVRINNAKFLLKNTNMKSYEISRAVGYENFNYFSTLFKKIVGLSPNEYRKMNTF